MGWIWGSGKDPDDATSKLDPALRDFLNTQTPKEQKYSPAQSHGSDPARSVNSPSSAPNEYRPQVGLDARGADAKHEDRPAVPRESLYQDGRYAHLWKNYRPPEEVAAASLPEQDRMSAVLEGFKDRKAAIGRAAVENCVLEQIAQKECFSSGSWTRLASMCRAEGRAFNRCYEMQSRFLKALGYLSQPRGAEEDERIQMHADKLYHEMLARERMAEELQEDARGRTQTPSPLIRPDETTKALGEDSAWARMRQSAAERGETVSLGSYSPTDQQRIMDKIKDMSEHEKAMELQLLAAEARVSRHLADQLREAAEDEKKQRAERRERRTATFGDAVKDMTGWQK